ncbi:MAG: hypothetical protein ACPG7F_09300 [Aggregatilineales bacterium]
MADGKKEIMKFQQHEVGYTPVSTTSGQACAGCRWFDGGYCQLVKGYPVQIMQTGWCQRFEGIPQSTAEADAVIEALETVTGAVDVALDSKGGDTPVVEVSVSASGADWQPDPGTASRLVTLEGRDTPNYTTSPGAVVMMDLTETPEGDKQNLLSRLGDTVKALNPFKKSPATSGFKVFENNRWLAWWTNNFEDREGEIFSEKAIERYIQRAETRIVPMPELWTYHIPGSRAGIADMVGGIGHFAIATGTFDDTPTGQATKAYYEKHAARMSHGYTYHPDDLRDGVYHDFNTFELSLLPPGAEANSFTHFEEVKTMQLNAQQVAHLEKVLGKEEAARIVADTETQSKALEAMNVAYKDFTTPDDPAETPEVQQAAKAAESNAAGLFAGVIGDISSLADTQTKAAEGITQNQQSVAALTEQVKALTDAVNTLNQAVQAQKNARPRIASKADDTIVPDDQLSEDVKQSMKKVDSFWGESVTG